MFNFLKEKSVDETEIIELKKKIAYMETDISILRYLIMIIAKTETRKNTHA